MVDTTPASLSLELGVSQKRIRDALRAEYGTLPSGTTRWQLDDEQVAVVRSALTGEHRELLWTLEIGDTVRRSALHDAYSGSRQNGIVTSSRVRDILVFSSSSGADYGYDAFEGLREDGSFAYSGEGQRGPQTFKRGNLALLHAAEEGRPIRVFTRQGVMATYVGEFTTGNPTCVMETIPDVDGNPREGIIFNLVPLAADTELLAPASQVGPEAQVAIWSPPDPSDVIVVQEEPTPPGERVVSRIEFALQADFGEWLRSRGDNPERLLLRAGGATLEPDLYVAASGWIVEAKKSSGRDYVRHAIGQVLDYLHLAERAGIAGTPVILLPGRPAHDLIDLIHNHGITLIVRSDDAFEVVS